MHACLEIGFWDRPQLLKLVSLLRNDLAGAYWVRCLELFMLHGDRRGRLPKEYDALALAAKARYPGKPAVLFSAFRTAGLIVGGGRKPIAMANWQHSPAGRYAELRELDRSRKRAARRAKGEDVRPGTSDGQAEDIHRNSERKRERASADAPPSPPPAGGDLGATRWEWLRQHAEIPKNSRVCTRHLATLSDEDWALVQWVQGSRLRLAPLVGRKKRLLKHDTAKFLSESEWLAFSGEWKAELAKVERAKKRAANGNQQPESAQLEQAAKARLDADAQATAKRLGELQEQLRAEGMRPDEARAKAVELYDAERAKEVS